MEAVLLERLVHVGGHAVEARENPAVFEGFRLNAAYARRVRSGQRRCSGRTQAIHVHEHETGCVPDLIGEVAIALGAARVEGDVRSGRSHGGEREARRVRAVLLDHLDRIEHVALGLGHLLPLGVAHQRMDVDLAKGPAVAQCFFTAIGLLSRAHWLLGRHHEPAAEHDHARHPEKQDVEARNQQRCRIEDLKIARGFWPTKGGEGKQSGREPGIEHVLILLELRAAALGTLRRSLTRHDDLAAIPAAPCRDAMAPP